MHVTEVDGQLRGQRTGRQLCQREAFLVVAVGDPPACVHRVAVHVAGQRHRAAEAKGAEPQEVQHDLPERVVRGFWVEPGKPGGDSRSVGTSSWSFRLPWLDFRLPENCAEKGR